MKTIKESGVIGVNRGGGLTLCVRWKFALFGILYLACAVSHLYAAEETHLTHEDFDSFYPNMFEVFVGSTYEDSSHGAEKGLTVALVYERRLSELFGVGALYERTGGDLDKWSIGVPLYIHPHKGWRFHLAPGLGHRHGDDKFLVLVGVAYEFELSERFVVLPEFSVELVDGRDAFIFGLAFGFGSP